MDPHATSTRSLGDGRRRALGVTAATIAALLLVGCGEDERNPAGGETTQSPVEAGAEQLAQCLTGAGLDAGVSTAQSVGVEVEHRTVEVDALDQAGAAFGEAQGADLYVVSDAAIAADNLTAFRFKTEPDDQAWVSGRVVVRCHYRAARDAPQVLQIQTCVDAVR